MPFNDPLPYRADVVVPAKDPQGRPTWKMSRDYITWLNGVLASLGTTPAAQGRATVENHTAAIGTTPIPSDELQSGRYRVSYFLRCRTPGGISSAFQVTLSFICGGVPCAFVGSVVNGNTTATFESETRYLVIDGGPINYEVSYASAGTPAVFDFYADIELVPAA